MLHPIRGLFEQTHIGNLNTIYSINDAATTPPVLLLHGFAGGCALWMCNWAALAEKHTVYAVDLPGFARSARIPYKGSSPLESIEYFMHQLEEWVKLSGIQTPFVLAGHSLGGYLSTQFAYRHPELIARLILVDPWGVPTSPRRKVEDLPWKYRVAASVIGMFNPLAAVRVMGPWAPDTFAARRPDIAMKYTAFFTDNHIVPDYIFHCNGDTPCGEAAFFYMYEGMAYARLPLENDFLEKMSPTIPVAFIYGDQTWMDSSAGARLAKAFPGKADFMLISDAGHNVFSDNHLEFSQRVLELLEVN
jgi:pimeloyl-ACP methyl ester carboxylesterase